MTHKFRLFLLYFILCSGSLFVGGILYLVGKEWIIIRWPSDIQSTLHNSLEQKTIKKNIRLSYWQHSRWNSEAIDLLWSTLEEENLASIIRSLLTLLEEEQVIEKKTSLQAVVCAGRQNDAYISLDRAPFNEDSSQFYKLMIIESILKTIRESSIHINNIYFLVHHQPIQDPHLDFSHGWPPEGFLTLTTQVQSLI